VTPFLSATLLTSTDRDAKRVGNYHIERSWAVAFEAGMIDSEAYAARVAETYTEPTQYEGELLNGDIHTGFDTETDELESGIAKAVTADEEFVFEGERIERETRLELLENGGVHVTQRIQGCFDSLTLNADVVPRLVMELGEVDER